MFVLLAVFIFIAFPGIIIGSESLFYRDMGLFGYPLAHFHREAFWRGEIPLWNPFNDSGVPFLAQWNTLVLYPGSLIYLLLPLPWSMNLFVFAHLFLAAGGMYALAWRWTGSRFAACVAGLVFAWNGLMLHALMWPNNIAALGWMPWVVLALERGWSEGGARRLIIAAITSAMQMLAGAPEVILLTWLVAGLLWLRDVWRASELPQRVGRGRLLLRLLFCGAVAGSLCAAQLLPFLELLSHSNRDASFGGNAYAMPIWGWANFFVPLFGCTPSVVGVYSQDEQQWTSSYYLGAASIMLAFMAWRAADSRAKWLAGIAVAGVLLAWGDNAPIYSTIKKLVPPLGFIRFPIKYVMLVAFALPLLAAYGTAQWDRSSTPRLQKRSLASSAMVVALTIAVIVGWAWWRPVAGTDAGVATINGLWRGALLAGIVFGLYLSQRGAWTGAVSRAAVLCLIALDMLTHMPKQNPTVPNLAYGGLPSDMSAVPRLGESRAMLSPPLQGLLEGAAVADTFTLYRAHRRLLLHNCNLIDRVPTVNGFYSLYVRAGDEIVRRLYHSTNYAALPLLDFLGVAQLSAPSEMFRWEARKTAMPLVTAGQRPVFASSGEIFAGIFSGEFRPRETVFLPAEARGRLGNASNACRVLASEISAKRITARVEARAPSLVVFAQTAYPSWRAFVDGKEVQVWTANHAFQAVMVEPGAQHVELRYEDRPFALGRWISITALLGCAGTFLVSGSRPRREKS